MDEPRICAVKVLFRPFGALFIFGYVACSSSSSVCAASIVEPGGTTDATALALSNPSEYAWRLFLFLNHQAKPGAAGVADENKTFDNLDPGASPVWETWAMASGQDASEVYRPGGAHPANWDDLPRGERRLVLDKNLERLSMLTSSRRLKPLFFPSAPLEQEVRQNRSTFEFVVSKEMYHRGDLEALLGSSTDPVEPIAHQLPERSQGSKGPVVSDPRRR
jgi:hypothetical protein